MKTEVIWDKVGGISNALNYIKAMNTQWRREDKLEKDFYLTAILNRIAELDKQYVFKGWTCLNKCHFGYYRLSEDLDFSVIGSATNRSQRSQIIQEFFDDIALICEELGLVCVDSRKRDLNRFRWMSRQYYSVITDTTQTILFDLKVYARYERSCIMKPIMDVFTDPLLGGNIFPKNELLCFSLEEAMAEKMRAALTRETPAIRDFYDIRYTQQQWFDFDSIRDLIAYEVNEVGNTITILSWETYNNLTKQMESDLRPVVFSLEWFDLQQVYNTTLSFIS